MLKNPGKGQNTKFIAMTFLLVKVISNSSWEKKKSNYVLKNAGSWAGFTLQTRYLVDTVIILINAGCVDLIFGLFNLIFLLVCKGGVKGCVRYIFASLFFKFKQEHLSN